MNNHQSYGRRSNNVGNQVAAFRNEELELKRIAKSFYITNFPKHWGIDELWKAMQVYGMVVDVFIPKKLSKIGRRFAFVRFIRVDNIETLIGRLNDAWYGSHHLFASLSRFDRKPQQETRPAHRVGMQPGVDRDRANSANSLQPGVKFSDLFKPDMKGSKSDGNAVSPPPSEPVIIKNKLIRLEKKDVMA